MAKQYLCDKCGRVIQDYSNDCCVYLFTNSYKLEHAQILGNSHYIIADLCPECQEEFTSLADKFIKGDSYGL